jgi:pSer/pThr/pTyr-binding forkhead associated (FHA) protein
VSRFHARLVVEEEGVFLIDLESTNGCKVNGNRITRQMIGNADAISIGSVKFKFSVGVPAELEARGMQETHVLLNDSAIFVPAPKVKTRTAQ